VTDRNFRAISLVAQQQHAAYSAAQMFLHLVVLCLVFAQPQAQTQLGAQEFSRLHTEAQSGNRDAQLKLARAYERGNGVQKDDQEALKWYRSAAKNGNPEAQENLGVIYLAGEIVKQDKQEAFTWFQKSARQGNANAMYDLGTAYYNGDGIENNDTLSFAWFTLAKEAGDEQAAGAIQRAKTELRAWKITQSFKLIAEMYDKGVDLPENQKEASRWWLKAADEGDHDAQSAIGIRLADGRGIPQDPEKARFFCTEAAKQGDSSGEYCLGYLHQHGLGVAVNERDARTHYERASVGGNRLAIKALARMEANGECGRTYRPSACLLYVTLAVAGDKEAMRDLVALKSRMDAKEWKKVQMGLPILHVEPAKLDAAMEKIKAQ